MPAGELYAPRLAELAGNFRIAAVAFVAVDSNQQDSLAELGHFAVEHKIGFPVLKDVGNVIADQLGAIRTPEVSCWMPTAWSAIGAASTTSSGFKERNRLSAATPTRRDLAIALDELLAGKAGQSGGRGQSRAAALAASKQPVANSEVTYGKQIASILNKNCVFCHREGQIGPFPLTSYEETVGWAEMIREVVQEQRMPPWHADPKIRPLQQ